MLVEKRPINRSDIIQSALADFVRTALRSYGELVAPHRNAKFKKPSGEVKPYMELDRPSRQI